MLTGAKKVVGVDIDTESVQFAREHYGSADMEFQVGDMRGLEFPDFTFDVVICLEGFEHVSREIGKAFIAETRRVLERDGLLILTSPVIVEGGAHSGNPHHVYEYPECELLDIINNNFYSIRIEEIPAPDNPIIRFVGRIRK
jgi:ubiquinone/menaquinone biosynthesis C-methylase UbiE